MRAASTLPALALTLNLFACAPSARDARVAAAISRRVAPPSVVPGTIAESVTSPSRAAADGDGGRGRQTPGAIAAAPTDKGSAPPIDPGPTRVRDSIAPQQLGAPRPTVIPFAIDIAALPHVELLPSRAPKLDGAVVRAADPRAPNVLTKGARVTVLGHRFGEIAVNDRSQPFYAFGDGGTDPMRTHGVVEFSWESFDPLAGGAVAVEQARGIYDLDRAQAVETWHGARARAVPVAGGLAYAYTSSCPTCEVGSREQLHLVLPGVFVPHLLGDATVVGERAELTPHVALPLDPTTSGAVRCSFVSPSSIADWYKRMRAQVPAAVGALGVVAVLGVEASRGSGSAEPVVIAYLQP